MLAKLARPMRLEDEGNATLIPLNMFCKADSEFDVGRSEGMPARDSGFNPAAWSAVSSTARVADGPGADGGDSDSAWLITLTCCGKAGMSAAPAVGDENSR